jgi:hypothetical protein
MARKQPRDRQSNERDLEEFLGVLALEGRSAHSVRSYRRDREALRPIRLGPPLLARAEGVRR